MDWSCTLEKEFSLIGIILLLYVNDYISFYITLECQSLILYILASRDSISSGLKYFVVGSLSSALILLGIVLIYKVTGFTEWHLINSLQDLPSIYWEGKIMIILGIMIKLGVPPFHQWNIEILSNTKTDLTIFFSTISKISLVYILYIFTRDFITLPLYGLNWSGIFIILSLIVGSFMGLIQNQVKRLLAYSGVVHMGFFLLALGDNTTMYLFNLPPIVFYILQYFISLVILLLITEKVNAYYLHSFKVNTFLMIILVIHLLSLAGFPPFLGFIAKWVILKGMIGKGFFICLIAMISSVFSFFIYFNWISLLTPSPTSSHLTVCNSVIIEIDLPSAWVIAFLTFSSFTMIFSFFYI